MKLVIWGSTGYIGSELIRQALPNPAIRSIVAISSSATPIPPGLSGKNAKLRPYVCDNFESYPDNIMRELETADACIWTNDITLIKPGKTPWDEAIKKVSCGYALTAIRTLAGFRLYRRENGPGPVRFTYISEHFAQYDISDDRLLTELATLRGNVEAQLFTIADKSNGAVVSCIAKPGIIVNPAADQPVPVLSVPTIELRNIAAALVDQAVNGFEKDTLSNNDLIRIGRSFLGRQ
ncbi:hypothetical protein F5Y05DRAFT_397728 [Hypoxylon sp. FL0543]|nr:hypothetical protein F5Y05DRAFT_397728 [Hypoxylon sp. FL0543]